eukprot:Partr_v1_DN27771_c2_g1_i1_m67485 putative Ribosome biogenesis ATPase
MLLVKIQPTSPATPSRILLHPKQMAALRLGASDPAWILDHGSSSVLAIGIAWPSIAVAEKSVIISEYLAQNIASESLLNSGCCIVRVAEAIPAASKCSIMPLDEESASKSNPLISVAVKEYLLSVRFIRQSAAISVPFMGAVLKYRVKSEAGQALIYPRNFLGSLTAAKSDILKSEEAFAVTSTTEIHLPPTNANKPISKKGGLEFSHIGGLKQQIAMVRETIDMPIHHPELFEKFGLDAPKGILLYGPPGTGKTLIARVVADQVNAHFLVINGAELMSQYVGETETRLRDIFTEARENAPSVVFIDELDSICSKRDESSTSGTEKRVVGTLLTLMDGVNGKALSGKNVIVLAATNRPDSIDPALRRPGRFDKEIEIAVPSPADRLDIFRVHLKRIPNDIDDVDLKRMADSTHGYVGADIASICREAGLMALKRWRLQDTADCLESSLKSLSIAESNVQAKVSYADLVAAKGLIRPSAMREIALQIPRTNWSDIGGMEQQKQYLQESILYPLRYPETFARMSITPPKGLLLYGPPGCSKTLLAKALATEAEHNFFVIKGSEVFNPYVGESERLIREVFRKARVNSPSIIFFDEIDVLAGTRGAGSDGGSSKMGDRILTTLLNEMDGMELLQHVTVVGATNRPEVLDPALMRPGRLDRLVYVGPPDAAARKAIIELQAQKTSMAVDIDDLVKRTEQWTGAEIVGVIREAAMLAIRENPAEAKAIEQSHMDMALVTTRPRLSKEIIKHYEDFAAG